MHCKFSLCIDHAGTVAPSVETRDKLIEAINEWPEIAETITELSTESSFVEILTCSAGFFPSRGASGPTSQHRSHIGFRFKRIEANHEYFRYYELFHEMARICVLPDLVTVVLEVIRTDFNGDRFVGWSGRLHVIASGQSEESAYGPIPNAYSNIKAFMLSDDIELLNIKQGRDFEH